MAHMFPGIEKIDAMYLQSTDTYGTTQKNKIWGTINFKNTTLAAVDTSQRALCTLTRNTYDDTILTTIFRYYNATQATNPTGPNEKLILYYKHRIGTDTIIGDGESTVWSGSLNPELSPATIQNLLGQYLIAFDGSITDSPSETQLFSLVDYQKFYNPQLQQNVLSISGQSTSEVSVNEYLA